jgi:hypothetical protein
LDGRFVFNTGRSITAPHCLHVQFSGLP